MSACRLWTVLPSGNVMRTGGTFETVPVASDSVAPRANKSGQRRGFLAVATLPSIVSTSAYARSPTSPISSNSAAFNSSPNSDLTGYRHREATEPRSFCIDVITGLLRRRGTRPTFGFRAPTDQFRHEILVELMKRLQWRRASGQPVVWLKGFGQKVAFGYCSGGSSYGVLTRPLRFLFGRSL